MIGIVGAGRVGAQAAMEIASAEIDDIALVDIIPGLAEGEALDICHSLSDAGLDLSVTGSTDYANIKDADLVIVTAGLARKPGMTRMDLLSKNSGIVASVFRGIAKNASESVIMIVINPVDVMTYTAVSVSAS
jgi:malate dehydrogenase